MNTITNIKFNTPVSFKNAQTTPQNEVSSLKSGSDNNTSSISYYLESLASINKPMVNKADKTTNVNSIEEVKKVDDKNLQDKPYKNNLRSMIQNNESVMIAIVPRLFTAEDKNGDEIISLSQGEKQGTFLSAISRLDELKDEGFNTIHILPIHPAGHKNALGTAGSIYAPKELVTDDGQLSIDEMLIDKNDPRTPSEQFKAFIDECHKRDIKVMLDLPSCASVDLLEKEPELMAYGRHGEEKTPQGWTDIRMFDPWADETKKTLNPTLLEMHKQYVDACIDLGVDGIRADVARAKPPEFWDVIIPYSHQKDPEFGWLAETYTYECASPQVNMPYDRPEDSLRAGFDEIYGQYHIFNEWTTNKEFTDYVLHNLDMSYNLPAGKTCIGSFMTHDDKTAMLHGGEDYANMTTIIQSTIPMCNPYFVDGFQTGDYYNYSFKDKYSDETFTDSHIMEQHPYHLDIFNLSRKPGGKCPDMARVLSGTLKMRAENNDLFADRNSSFIELPKFGDKKDEIIAYARHNNGRTAIVIANRNPNRRLTCTVGVPGLKESQELKNMVPAYGDKSEFQVEKNKLRVNLAPSDAYVFEVDTPNIEQDLKGHVFKQKVHD